MLFISDKFAKETFKSMIFGSFCFSNYEQLTPHADLVFLLLKDNFFDKEEILNVIETMKQTPAFFLFFAWFCPEICESKPDFFRSIVSHISLPEDSPNLLKIFYSQLDVYKADNWKLLREKRVCCYEKQSIMGLISSHHVDASILDSINNNNRIRASIFEVNWILWNYPSYIEFAAYYGALEHLKFFMNQGIHFGEDFGTLDILSYAIAGGHQDTINFLKNDLLLSTDLFPNSEFMNILFHRNCFNELPKQDKFSSIFGSLGQIAALSNNLLVLQSLTLYDNVDYLSSSLEFGESDATQFLLAQSNIKISNDFVARLVSLDSIDLISKIFSKCQDLILKQTLLLQKEQLFISILCLNEICSNEISDEIVILSILLKFEKAFRELIVHFPSKILVKTSENETLLSLAVQNKLISTVQFILDLNTIDVNEADIYTKSFLSFIRWAFSFYYFNWSPIHFAVSENMIDVVRILIQKGHANIHLKTKQISFYI